MSGHPVGSAVALEELPEEAVSAPIAAKMAPGPLTYAGNRVLMATRAKPRGTFRVAIIGDSMSYGAGLPYRRGFSPRLAAHLNAAAPGTWVECVSFGVSGACIHHAAGRVLTHAIPADADMVIVTACSNDAFLLGPQAPDLAVLGAQWVTFKPLVHRSLAAFKQAMAAAGRQPMVVYLDHLRQAGEVSIPDALGSVCAELDLPFVDGAGLLTGYQYNDLIVSPADGHLNGVAYDVIARHVTQTIVSRGFLPRAVGFDDASWIEAVERGAEARVENGLAGPLAYGEALWVLDGKWLNRRNTRRREFATRYAAAKERLLAGQRSSLARLAYTAFQERLRVTQPLVAMWRAEMWANDLMTLTFALEHFLERGDADMLGGLGHLREEEDYSPTVPAALARWEAIREGVASLHITLQRALALKGPAEVLANLDYLGLWTSRISQWLRVVEECAARYLTLLPGLVPPLDHVGSMVLSYIDRRATVLQEKLAELTTVASELERAGLDATRAAGASHITLELIMSAAPGPESWTFTVGMESAAPAFSERHVGTGYFIRDGNAHAYEHELPVTLSGHVHIYAEGVGLKARNGGLRVHKAVLRWPQGGLTPVTLPPPMVEASTDISAALVFRIASTLPRTTAPL